LRDAQAKNRATIGELRVIGRGLHPAVLDDRGLDAALSAVVSGSPVPVSLSVSPGLEAPIEVAEAAYFVVSEAVANMLKHAKARTASVTVSKSGGSLEVDVHDDGCGGADAQSGTGLAGIAARVRALDGDLTVSSPRGGPTHVHAELPCD
jgi:signal transduction histidine kinase